MNEFEQAITGKFGAENVRRIDTAGNIPLLAVEITKRSRFTILMTNGLSSYTMPVPEKYKERSHAELYFCLPDYWDLESRNGKWVLEWINKMAKHVVDKHTWFGPGHTFPNGNPAEPLSDTMKQRYLMLYEPIFLHKELQPLSTSMYDVHFLAIMPIFEDEMDYKMGKGTFKLVQKMEGKGITELLDDFRMTALKSKWRVFGR